MDDYDLSYELQRSQFLRDCLHPEIDFQLKDGSVIIYKKLDSGISEEISVDELIYFIHYDVAEYIKEESKRCRRICQPPPGPCLSTDIRAFHASPSVQVAQTHLCILNKYKNLSFGSIDSIRKTVENMKIILKYGEKKEEEEVEDKEEEEEKEEPLMTEVSTVKIG